MPFDIGIGILLGLWLGPIEANSVANALLGVFFVLLPDTDGLIYYGSKFSGRGGLDKRLADHRELFHYPLVFIALGSFICLILAPDLLPIFIAGSLAQFAHDSVGTGWGIPWLYPFRANNYKFFYQYDLHRARQPQKFMWIWSREQQRALIKKYGDPDWHKHTFQIWKYGPAWQVGEVAMLLVGLAVLFLT